MMYKSYSPISQLALICLLISPISNAASVVVAPITVAEKTTSVALKPVTIVVKQSAGLVKRITSIATKPLRVLTH